MIAEAIGGAASNPGTTLPVGGRASADGSAGRGQAGGLRQSC